MNNILTFLRRFYPAVIAVVLAGALFFGVSHWMNGSNNGPDLTAPQNTPTTSVSSSTVAPVTGGTSTTTTSVPTTQTIVPSLSNTTTPTSVLTKPRTDVTTTTTTKSTKATTTTSPKTAPRSTTTIPSQTITVPPRATTTTAPNNQTVTSPTTTTVVIVPPNSDGSAPTTSTTTIPPPDTNATYPPVTDPSQPPVYEDLNYDACASLDINDVSTLMGDTATAASQYTGECNFTTSATSAGLDYYPAAASTITDYFSGGTALTGIGDAAVFETTPVGAYCVAAKQGDYAVTVCVDNSVTGDAQAQMAQGIAKLAIAAVVKDAPTITASTQATTSGTVIPGLINPQTLLHPNGPTTSTTVSQANSGSGGGPSGGTIALTTLGLISLVGAASVGVKTGVLSSVISSIFKK